jgi:hypothetical protein
VYYTIAANRAIAYRVHDLARSVWFVVAATILLAAILGAFLDAPEAALPLLMLGQVRNGAAVVPAVPFVAAAHEHVEPAFTISRQLTAATQQLDPIDIPSYGYLRHVFLEVTAASGVIGTFVAGEDFPFNIIQSVTLLDVNGAPIVGPIDGYALLWANIAGGYAYRQDPRDAPWHVGAAPNPAFFLRVPVEISHFDGLGSLANQNSAAPYKLQITLNSTSGIGTGAFGTIPTITVRGWAECWSLPNATDVRGRPQQQLPPVHGTGQFWTTRRPDVLAGNINVPITRVGNLIRNLVFITRTAGGVRADTVMPDPAIINWDGRQQFQFSQRYWQQSMFEKLVDATRDTGVWILSMAHSQQNRAGDDTPNLWWPTVQATRMELSGTNALAGSIQVVVNDIQPVEVVPAERYTENSDTTFRAAPGPASPVAA